MSLMSRWQEIGGGSTANEEKTEDSQDHGVLGPALLIGAMSNSVADFSATAEESDMMTDLSEHSAKAGNRKKKKSKKKKKTRKKSSSRQKLEQGPIMERGGGSVTESDAQTTEEENSERKIERQAKRKQRKKKSRGKDDRKEEKRAPDSSEVNLSQSKKKAPPKKKNSGRSTKPMALNITSAVLATAETNVLHASIDIPNQKHVDDNASEAIDTSDSSTNYFVSTEPTRSGLLMGASHAIPIPYPMQFDSDSSDIPHPSDLEQGGEDSNDSEELCASSLSKVDDGLVEQHVQTSRISEYSPEFIDIVQPNLRSSRSLLGNSIPPQAIAGSLAQNVANSEEHVHVALVKNVQKRDWKCRIIFVMAFLLVAAVAVIIVLVTKNNDGGTTSPVASDSAMVVQESPTVPPPSLSPTLVPLLVPGTRTPSSPSEANSFSCPIERSRLVGLGEDGAIYSIHQKEGSSFVSFFGYLSGNTTVIAADYLSKRFYAHQTEPTPQLVQFEPNIGLELKQNMVSISDNIGSFKAIEFVGGTLYGVTTASELYERVPETESFTRVGTLSSKHPIVDLAWDGERMFGVTAAHRDANQTGESSELYVIDLETGAATSVCFPLLSNFTSLLHYVPENVLYAGTRDGFIMSLGIRGLDICDEAAVQRVPFQPVDGLVLNCEQTPSPAPTPFGV